VQLGFKADAGRPVQLADDHAFRAVDDKRAAIRHERNLAHVHAFLLGAGFVPQLKGHIQRRAVGFRLADRLQRIQFGFADFVLHEIQRHLVVVALDRKDFLEDGLQAHFSAL
jgi:hypothetical protein